MREIKSQSVLTMRHLIVTALGALLLWAAVLGACSLLGVVELRDAIRGNVLDWPLWGSLIWQGRVFRLCAATVVGMALAVGGMALQGLLRNVLAEPYVLGLSSGAGVGVLLGPLLATVLAWPEWLTGPPAAVLGAALTAAAVYAIARRAGGMDPVVLLLGGVIINVFNGAMILLLMQFIRPERILSFIGWSMGRLPESLWHEPILLLVAAVMLLIGWTVVMRHAAGLNVLALGDDVAVSSGVSVGRLRTMIFLAVCLMTAGAVALAGPIGFIGLIVPHICRILFGADHRLLGVICPFGGAIFLMIADTLCRMAGMWTGAGEIPVGVVTALIGGPFFIVLLCRSERGALS